MKIKQIEDILKADSELRDKLTNSINMALGYFYTHLVGQDFITFAKGYRINADKRRIKSESAEQELLALEELDLMDEN